MPPAAAANATSTAATSTDPSSADLTGPTGTGTAPCCSPQNREAATAAGSADLAHLLKAVADPTRLRLISLVTAHPDAEACVCDLTTPLGLSQGTVSHHLKVLVDAKIFARSKRGTWAYYRLVPHALESLAARLVGI